MLNKIRNRLFRSFADLGATAFLGLIIPITYWFELAVVLPEIFPYGTFLYYAHLLFGTFILYQIVGNWVFVMLTDTSIKKVLIKLPPKEEIGFGSRDKWRFCSVCESVQPPRTWHCKVCNTCIIKRDHHCLFTGCCIGQNNQRFFMVLIFYLCLATTYSSMYNNYFIWIKHGKDYMSLVSLVKMVFPMAWLMYDFSTEQYYLLIYMVSLIGSLFTGALLVYHGQNMIRGVLAYEANNKNVKTSYSLGWKKNIELVLGKRWYLTLINPFAISKLPHDGVSWDEIGNSKSS